MVFAGEDSTCTQSFGVREVGCFAHNNILSVWDTPCTVLKRLGALSVDIRGVGFLRIGGPPHVGVACIARVVGSSWTSTQS